MRDIKFRAWSKERRAFIVGFNMVNFHSYYNKGLEPCIYRYNTEWKLSEIELLQFTGLLDKNGLDIYEGDVVDIDEVGRAEVIFESGCFFARWIDDPEAHMDAVGLRMKTGHKWESTVLGNIYQNPELLKA